MQDGTEEDGHMQRPQRGERGPRTSHDQGAAGRSTAGARLTEAPGSQRRQAPLGLSPASRSGQPA